MNLTLGTANLGGVYGVTNPEKYDASDSKKLLEKAISFGITSFDTAASYGQAETLLGSTTANIKSVEITTKLNLDKTDKFKNVDLAIDASLNRLGASKISNLLFHNTDAHENENLDVIVKAILKSGKVTNVGLSVYTLEDVISATKKSSEMRIFQVPENILDRRLETSKEMKLLASHGILFDVRSVFLQGLLLLSQNNLPSQFNHIKLQINAIENLARKHSTSKLNICLSYIEGIEWKNRVVIAAQNESQLDEIINFEYLETDFSVIPVLDQKTRDPRFWGQL